MISWDSFQERWVLDYEFLAGSGEPQTPICYVAKNVDTGEVIRHWISGNENAPEYPVHDKALIVAYFASAEMGCHIPLGFQIPPYLLDLYTEFRVRTNGLSVASSLLDACNYYGLPGGDSVYKERMRERIIDGAPYNQEEQEQILDYCALDVNLTTHLFQKMQEGIDLPKALLRGRYMAAVAQMEHSGVPLDVSTYNLLLANWGRIKMDLITRIDSYYNVYEDGVFKANRFAAFLAAHRIPWDLTPTGLPRTDEEYFKEQVKSYPILKPLQELRYSISQLKLNALQVGDDGRNRALLSPFRTITGRNAPSSAKFIFGNAVWLRHLIKPPEGKALAYIDYEQQEIAIAAALSGDENLKEAYVSGDPYIGFAIQAGAAPSGATKQTHPKIRELYKSCMFGINYGMSYQTFAKRANLPPIVAKDLYTFHKSVFRCYWRWLSGFMDSGQLSGEVNTNFGWRYKTGNRTLRTLQNWPMQAHGAEILRLAIILCLQNEIQVIAPVHDAILIEASLDEIDQNTTDAQYLMTRASERVINFPIRTEAIIVRYPDRYTEQRGTVMWESVCELVASEG